MTVRVSIREFTLGNPLYRGATVAFHKVVNGVKSTQLATLYKSSTGTETLANPQKLDSDGRLKQTVYVEEPVIASVTGIAVPSHDTGIIGKQLVLSDVSDYIETLLDDPDAATARATLGIPGVLADYYHRSGSSAITGSLNQPILTTGGTSTAYTLSPGAALSAYAAGVRYYVRFHVACGANPTLQISGLASPPNLVKRNPDGTLSNLSAGDVPADWRSWVTLVSATQALVEDLPVDLSQYYRLSGTSQITGSLNESVLTTGGTSTAYTLTPTSALTAYAAGHSYLVIFHTACGANPTLQISGLANPPNLVKRLADGSLANLAANDIPANWRSRVTLLSATQALVEDIPDSLLLGPHTLSGSGTSITVTGIPAWANLVVVSFRNMSWNGTTGDLRLRLGTSGGIETTNYVGGHGYVYSTGGSPGVAVTVSNGVSLGGGWDAASEFNGQFILTRMSNTQWAINGNFHSISGSDPILFSIACTSVLTGQLDRVQMLNTGTATFDNGTLSVLCLG